MYHRSQIAANTGDVVQIDKNLWNKLDDTSKTSLIMHEALWTAVGSEYIGSCENIRKLTRLLMNPKVGQYPAATLAGYLKQFVGSPDSPLVVLADIDAAELAVPSKFDIREVMSELGPQPIVTVASSSPMKGMMITSYKPNPIIAHAVVTYSNQQNHSIKHGYGYDAAVVGRALIQPLVASKACSIQYGEYSDWRLPTIAEIKALHALGLFSIRFPHRTLAYRFFRDTTYDLSTFDRAATAP